MKINNWVRGILLILVCLTTGLLFIGLAGTKYNGRLNGRPDAEWERQNTPGLTPASLYMAQLEAATK